MRLFLFLWFQTFDLVVNVSISSLVYDNNDNRKCFTKISNIPEYSPGGSNVRIVVGAIKYLFDSGT